MYQYIDDTPLSRMGSLTPLTPILNHFKKILLFVINMTLLLICFFGPEVCGVLASWPGIEPAPLALEGIFLITGPGKSHDSPCFMSGLHIVISLKKKIPQITVE